MNEVGEKGEVLVFSTGGSGAAMDDASAVVTTPSTDPSGEQLAGILLNDVVNLDLTRQHINWQKFLYRVEAELDKYGKERYIKKDLEAYR